MVYFFTVYGMLSVCCRLAKSLSESLGYDIIVTPCDTPQHGNFTSSIAFGRARQEKKSPQVIAQKIVDTIVGHPMIASAEAVNGYVNIVLHDSVWITEIHHINTTKECYGHQEKNSQGGSVSLEYVSANPTGPLHAAHMRGAILGDVLARLGKACGYLINREYYINDAGGQISVLVASLLLHAKAITNHTEAVIPAGLYPGNYVKELAQKLIEQYPEWHTLSHEEVTRFAVEHMMQNIVCDLHKLGVYHDTFTSEKHLQQHGMVDKAIKALTDAGKTYEGTLPAPQDAPENWVPESLLLFRASAYGDTQDRALQRADGAWTYFAGDIAYHLHKANQPHVSLMIDVWGADHDGHTQRLTSALEGLMHCPLHIVTYQMVDFYHEGTMMKMSKRAGTFLTIDDILSRMDVDTLRFMMLTKKAETHLHLDVDLLQQQTKDNPIFYVQYAHARCCSVLRGYEKIFSMPLSQQFKWEHMSQDMKTTLALAADWPRQIQEAWHHKEPHRITSYLYALAQMFHGLWHTHSHAGDRFLQPKNKEKTDSLCFFVQAVAYVIRSALAVLGIKAKSHME